MNRRHSITTLILYQTTANFNNARDKSLLKTVLVKEKMLKTSIFFFYFSFSCNVFYPIKSGSHLLSYSVFVVCNSVQFGQLKNFVVVVTFDCMGKGEITQRRKCLETEKNALLTMLSIDVNCNCKMSQ